MQEYLTKLLNHELLTRTQIHDVCSLAISLLVREPNLPLLSSPVTIVGDIHGQFHDLLNMFHLFQTPATTKYIFLGDYVDRGGNSTSTYLILLVYKILYPENIFLVRGNHEIYNLKSSFHEEICKKYDEEVYEKISETFMYLLVGCIVDGRFICIHGGISPGAARISQMQRINRFTRTPTPLFNDIMWSDPDNTEGFGLSQRGAGYLYGEEVSKRFLCLNQLNYIIRAHQVVYSGFAFHFKDKCVVTVWSAPNYMYRFGNKASVLVINKEKILTEDNFRIFTDVHKIDE